MLLSFLSLFAGASALAADVLDPNNPPHGRFLDEWAEVYMAGGKVGYMQSTMAREGEIVHTRTVTRLRIGRADSPVEIQMTQSTTETLAGVPVAFGSEMNFAVMKTHVRGAVKDGRVQLVKSQLGMNQTNTFDYPEGALMVWGDYRERLLRGFKPGTEYTLEAYSPEMREDGAIRSITKIGDWEQIDLHGKPTRAQRMNVTVEAPTGRMDMTSWVDEQGRALKATFPVPGLGDMVMLTTDAKTALADFVPPEVFMRTVIKANRRLDPKRLERVTYRLRATAPEVDLSEIPKTDMQVPSVQPDGSVELTVVRRPHKLQEGEHRTDGKASGRDATDPSRLREYLDSNLMMNISDPELVKLAKKAAGKACDPFTLADKLRRFVTDYVSNKTLNIGFATASEVCRTREGDCSEHAVLLAALGRLHGLPSRVAVGVAYVPVFGRQDDVFGYHMWTQFYIDGRWVDVDAALRETVCSPTRIAFATSSLKSTGLADLSLPMISKIGSIGIEIEKVGSNSTGTD
jgi:hypothetical protein